MQQVTTKDVYGKKHQVDAALLKWRPSAYGIVFKDNKVLLVPQFQGKYDVPGGGAEITETIEETVLREVYEETGLTVKIRQIIGVKQSFFSSTHDKASTQHYNSLLFYYLCEYVSGEVSTDGFDEEEIHYAQEAQWVPLDKLDDIELASTVDYKDLIRKAYEVIK